MTVLQFPKPPSGPTGLWFASCPECESDTGEFIVVVDVQKDKTLNVHTLICAQCEATMEVVEGEVMDVQSGLEPHNDN